MERNLRQEEWATIPFASLRPFRMTKISLHVILQIIDIWHFSTDCTFPQIWNENAKLYSPFAFVLEKKLGLEHSNVTRMEGDWHSPHQLVIIWMGGHQVITSMVVYGSYSRLKRDAGPVKMWKKAIFQNIQISLAILFSAISKLYIV